MSLSPLQLKRSYIEEFYCKANPNFKADGPEGKKGFKVFFQTGEDEKEPFKKNIRLTINQEIEKDSNEPYEFKVVMVGFFEIQKKLYDDVGVEKAERMLLVNGPSVLYSAARELLSLFSARGPYRNDNVEILLPTITFLDFAAKEDKGKKKQKTKEHP